MRTIKFRAWYPNQKYMNYQPSFTGEINNIFNKKENGAVYMQYTGLKDKNGKDIYEGDIVRFDDNYMTENPTQEGHVSFDSASFCIDSGYAKHYRWMDYECEVIGNIYEDPKLLEGTTS